MGSFQYTCGISRLPISEGTPVRFLLLAANAFADNLRCYVNCDWEVYLGPIRAKYNDYGSIHNIVEGPEVEEFFSHLSDDAIPKEVGENRYHDVAVQPGMSREEWLLAIWERRVEVVPYIRISSGVKDVMDRALSLIKDPEIAAKLKKSQDNLEAASRRVPVQVVQAMIREDVWQYVLTLSPPVEGFTEVQRVQRAMDMLRCPWVEGNTVGPQFVEDHTLSDYHSAMSDIAYQIEFEWLQEEGLTLKPGRFYESRDGEQWLCYRLDLEAREHCQAYCIRVRDGRQEYFYLDGRYDLEGKTDVCLIQPWRKP